MKIAILTSRNQWFIPYAKELSKKINGNIFFTPKDIKKPLDICFVLSYHHILKKDFLSNNNHNIVIHASNLPSGKGFAPMFWQVLEGKNNIIFSMFEANENIDDGDIYMQNTLSLSGLELYDELREKQANFIIDMCLEFLSNYEKYQHPTKQDNSIKESFYKKRNPNDNKLDINKSIKEQFNLLRISDNKEFPAFFEIDNIKYKLSIDKELNH